MVITPGTCRDAHGAPNDAEDASLSRIAWLMSPPEAWFDEPARAGPGRVLCPA
eukprot:NODE_1878_length_736_cov_23074.746725_g1578_i0.p3 GENE.NODE_1878_length_736_cov_23074.746725_g1578_i0~~NODE_1878_length_736_cov_23074.746725_g1578_i0.p3  ORF type:complete len:53 (+),score=0.12 NODE_1878_length_736_cov_23074.746725_g1578_i0:189-347(+)